MQLVRLVRLFLRTYPQSSRERYREEITEVVSERIAEARLRSGLLAAGWLLLRELTGIVLSGVARRRRAKKRPRLAGEKGFGKMIGFVQDLRIAARGLFRRPVFTLAAVVALALGIGSSIAIFTVFHAVVLRPLPFPDPDGAVGLARRPHFRPSRRVIAPV